nr:translation initiation factor IF-2-like [Manis javanica]
MQEGEVTFDDDASLDALLQRKACHCSGEGWQTSQSRTKCTSSVTRQTEELKLRHLIGRVEKTASRLRSSCLERITQIYRTLHTQDQTRRVYKEAGPPALPQARSPGPAGRRPSGSPRRPTPPHAPGTVPAPPSRRRQEAPRAFPPFPAPRPARRPGGREEGRPRGPGAGAPRRRPPLPAGLPGRRPEAASSAGRPPARASSFVTVSSPSEPARRSRCARGCKWRPPASAPPAALPARGRLGAPRPGRIPPLLPPARSEPAAPPPAARLAASPGSPDAPPLFARLGAGIPETL